MLIKSSVNAPEEYNKLKKTKRKKDRLMAAKSDNFDNYKRARCDLFCVTCVTRDFREEVKNVSSILLTKHA